MPKPQPLKIEGAIVPVGLDDIDSRITPADVEAADKARRKVYPKGMRAIVTPS